MNCYSLTRVSKAKEISPPCASNCIVTTLRPMCRCTPPFQPGKERDFHSLGTPAKVAWVTHPLPTFSPTAEPSPSRVVMQWCAAQSLSLLPLPRALTTSEATPPCNARTIFEAQCLVGLHSANAPVPGLPRPWTACRLTLVALRLKPASFQIFSLHPSASLASEPSPSGTMTSFPCISSTGATCCSPPVDKEACPPTCKAFGTNTSARHGTLTSTPISTCR